MINKKFLRVVRYPVPVPVQEPKNFLLLKNKLHCSAHGKHCQTWFPKRVRNVFVTTYQDLANILA